MARWPVRIAKWLGLAYAAAWASYALAGGGIDSVGMAVGWLFMFCWQIGPVLVAAMLVKASRTRLGAWLFVAIETALAASTILVFVVALSQDWSALGASVFLALIGPFYQYVAVAIALLLAFLLGWRARDSWLKDAA